MNSETVHSDVYRPLVLIAQSDNEVLEKITDCVRKYNKFDCNTASTGREVIDKVNKTYYDAVILGLRFPDITGTTIAPLIREYDPFVNIAFLTQYESGILKMMAERHDFEIWSRNEKLADTAGLCGDIYSLAMQIETKHCNRSKEKEMRQAATLNLDLTVPKSLMDVLNGVI